MAYEPTVQMDNNEFQSRSNKGWYYDLAAFGIEDWPTDGYMITYDDDEFKVVPVKVCDPVSIWGTLDTNVSPAKLAIAAVTRSYEAENMQPPDEETGQPGIEPVVRVMRGYLTEQDAIDALRTELEV
jgi:hypothetical protein